jgi:hypothetical protein
VRLSTNLRSIASLCAITWPSAVDAPITHLVAIALLLSGQYWLSSLTFSVDSAMRIAAAPILATRIAMTSETLRGRCSFMLKCLTVVLGSAVILASAETSRAGYSEIALFVLAKMTSVLDGLFGAHLIYKLEADRQIGLSTSSAALNIVGRGATAIAPALSLAILHSAALAEAIVLSVLLLQATAMWFSRDLFLGDAETRATPPVPHRPATAAVTR